MDLSEALDAARAGELVRDDSGTMRPNWVVKFKDGRFIYVNPRGDDAHPIVFRDEHRASPAWRTVRPDE